MARRKTARDHVLLTELRTQPLRAEPSSELLKERFEVDLFHGALDCTRTLEGGRAEAPRAE